MSDSDEWHYHNHQPLLLLTQGFCNGLINSASVIGGCCRTTTDSKEIKRVVENFEMNNINC